jgi:hypothetical protein
MYVYMCVCVCIYIYIIRFLLIVKNAEKQASIFVYVNYDKFKNAFQNES